MENSPHVFCTATETVANISNAAFCYNTPALMHILDDMAKIIVREKPPTLYPALAGLTIDSYLRRDSAKPAAYVGVFVDDF